MYKTLFAITLISVALFSVNTAEASSKLLSKPKTSLKAAKSPDSQSLRPGDIDPTEGLLVTCQYSKTSNQYACEEEDTKCKKEGDIVLLFWTETTTIEECHATGGEIIAYL